METRKAELERTVEKVSSSVERQDFKMLIRIEKSIWKVKTLFRVKALSEFRCFSIKLAEEIFCLILPIIP
jgi:type IV secretory pathway component VirB8